MARSGRSGKWWAEPLAKVKGWSIWIWNMRYGKVPVGPVGLVLLLMILFLLLRLGNLRRGATTDFDSGPALPSLLESAADSAANARPDPGSDAMQRALDDANQRFTYMGGPIHPFGIRELMESVTDENPGPVSVDLAGINGGYRYPTAANRNSDGSVTAKNPLKNECLETEEGAEPEDGDGYYTYHRIGGLPNGWHVLRVGDNGGGPSVFESLLLVRFRLDNEYGETVRRRLLMERRGMIRLGDRYEGRIRIHGDSITLTADVSSGSRQEDATFAFPATD